MFLYASSALYVRTTTLLGIVCALTVGSVILSSAELRCRGPVSPLETSAHFKHVRKIERERSTKREVGRREATISTAVRAANHKMAVHHLLMQEQGLVWSIPGQMRKSACCINFATLIKRYANSSNYLRLRRKWSARRQTEMHTVYVLYHDRLELKWTTSLLSKVISALLSCSD